MGTGMGKEPGTLVWVLSQKVTRYEGDHDIPCMNGTRQQAGDRQKEADTHRQVGMGNHVARDRQRQTNGSLVQ